MYASLNFRIRHSLCSWSQRWGCFPTEVFSFKYVNSEILPCSLQAIYQTPFFFPVSFWAWDVFVCSKITFFETFLVLFVCAIQNLSDFCSSSKISSSRGRKWHSNKNWTRMCSSYLVIKHYFSKSFLRYLHLCICLNYFVRIKKIGCSVAVCLILTVHLDFHFSLFVYLLPRFTFVFPR